MTELCHLMFFGFWAQNFFGGPNKKSALIVCTKSIFTLILKDSDKFIKNVGGVWFLVNDTWAKWGFMI